MSKNNILNNLIFSGKAKLMTTVMGLTALAGTMQSCCAPCAAMRQAQRAQWYQQSRVVYVNTGAEGTVATKTVKKAAPKTAPAPVKVEATEKDGHVVAASTPAPALAPAPAPAPASVVAEPCVKKAQVVFTPKRVSAPTRMHEVSAFGTTYNKGTDQESYVSHKKNFYETSNRYTVPIQIQR